MTTAALVDSARRSARRLRRLNARALRRGVIAGATWGIVCGAGLTALEAWRCGSVCLDAAVFVTVVSVAAGILTIGPLAALGRAS